MRNPADHGGMRDRARYGPSPYPFRSAWSFVRTASYRRHIVPIDLHGGLSDELHTDDEPMALFRAEQNRAELELRFQITADGPEVDLKILQMLTDDPPHFPVIDFPVEMHKQIAEPGHLAHSHLQVRFQYP